MPTYQYQCKDCAEKFSKTEHIKEHDTDKPVCPKCKSEKVEQVLAPFFAKKPNKS